ncbi:MAG: phosphomannomutase/phosphoglucomutase [Patescibacteria group bacterium]|nr:phosphomannomutase/phosphoglucomutase [Patescibacteria group bacterium]
MQIPRQIFKMYDIRGLVGEEITPELALAIGRGFAALLRKEKPSGELKVAVGRDMRQTSLGYQTQVMQGLIESGVKVFDIGLVSTPAFYFGVGETSADGGIMVSASHNPAAYNGFKMTREQAIPISGETGITELADIIETESYISSDTIGTIEVIENIPEKAVEAEMAFAGEAPIGQLKIVADSGNGMGAQYLDILFNRLGLDFEKIFWELDGSFPNHEADPLKEENVVVIKYKVVEQGADLGIATDGDGDRIFFIDNLGQVVPQAIVRGILAEQILKKFPAAAIGYDIRPGRITKDLILAAGGKPFVTRVGHSLIKEKMREMNAVYGGESSGHFFYKFERGTYEGPIVAVLHFLHALHASGKSCAEFVEPYKIYVHSGELNFTVDDKVAAMQRIKDHFQDGELNELDGISITYPNFWFNVRPSNTEPILRFALEAVDEDTMEQKRSEITQLIQGE